MESLDVAGSLRRIEGHKLEHGYFSVAKGDVYRSSRRRGRWPERRWTLFFPKLNPCFGRFFSKTPVSNRNSLV